MMQAASDEVRATPRRVRTRIALERKWWTLSRSLRAGFTDRQWVIDAYALALATCVLNAGSLANLLGRKRVFVAGVVLFTAASALCGAASTPLFLILAALHVSGREPNFVGLSLVRRRDFAAASAPAQA